MTSGECRSSAASAWSPSSHSAAIMSSGHTAASDSRSSSRKLSSSSAMTALNAFMRNPEDDGQTLAGLDIDRERGAIAVHRAQTLPQFGEHERIVERANSGSSTNDGDAN